VAVSVVQDGPPWNPVTPVFRAAVTATGVLLRTLARVALPLAVLASLYWAVATFDEEQNLSQEVGGYRSGPLAAGAAGLRGVNGVHRASLSLTTAEDGPVPPQVRLW
jgi:hypothetical protein